MPENTTSLRDLLPLIIFMVIVLIMFYTIVINPAKKRQKKHQDLVSSISEGEEIITAGGIYGRVTKVRDNTVEVEVAQGVRLKFDRRAIRRRTSEDE